MLVALVILGSLMQVLPAKAVSSVEIILQSDHFVRGQWSLIEFYSHEDADSLSFGSSLPIWDIPDGCKWQFAPVHIINCKPGRHSFYLFVQESEADETVNLTVSAWYGVERNSEELIVTLKSPVGTPDAPPELEVFPALGKIRTDIYVPVLLTGMVDDEVLGFQLDVKTSEGLNFYGVKLAKEIPGAQAMWPSVPGYDRTHRVVVGAPVDLREGIVLAYLKFEAWNAGIYEFWLNNITVGTTTFPELIVGSVNADFYALDGQITYKDSALPVSDVFVAISEGGLFQNTDQQGKYSFGVTPGTNNVHLSKGMPNEHNATVITAEDARVTMLQCLLPDPADKVCNPEMSVDYQPEVTPQDVGITLKCAQGNNDSQDQCGDWAFDPDSSWAAFVEDDLWFRSVAVQHGDSTHNWPGITAQSASVASVAQPDPLVIMSNVTVPLNEQFVYTVTLANFQFTSFRITIQMGSLNSVRPEGIDVRGVDTFGPSFDADTNTVDITGYAFEPSDGATITIPLDLPADTDIVVTRLLIGEHTLLEGEVARGQVHVEVPQKEQQALFLPAVVTSVTTE